MNVAIHNYKWDEMKYSPFWTYNMNEKGNVKTSIQFSLEPHL